ncbi:uncharacterized protein LOC108467278 isoform X2 [Gossypium arboreum]|uniref:uncharacterized protein LOC108467278 isoform X2 n=1 Tax=Gossypium arboreum TaxID=29729 RepID=UPI0008192D94|nr:uncharacterized protein LOC108467278 isoform X2 [Gossypium arboreum]
MSGEDKREQEKVRSVLTNHSMSSPCIVSFQVPEDSNDKLQLQYLSEERQFRMIEKGDTWRWRPPIEGGRGNNPIPFQTICGSLSFGNNSIPIMSKMVCDLGNFFSSKWPDLRTNRLQEGGNDTNPDVSWFDTIRKYRAWPKFEGPKFKMKPDLKFQ